MAKSFKGSETPRFVRWLIFTLLLLVPACGRGDRDVSASNTSTPATPESVSPGPQPSAPEPVSTSANVTGLVTDENKVPVSGAILDLEALDGQPNAAIESLRRTDEKGRYYLMLAAGRWTLTVSAPGFDVEEVSFTVPANGVLDQDVVLARTASTN